MRGDGVLCVIVQRGRQDVVEDIHVLVGRTWLYKKLVFLL